MKKCEKHPQSARFKNGTCKECNEGYLADAAARYPAVPTSRAGEPPTCDCGCGLPKRWLTRAGLKKGGWWSCRKRSREAVKRSQRKNGKHDDRRRRRNGFGESQRPIVRDEVFAMFGGRCYACGCELVRTQDHSNPRRFEVEHLVPITKNGPDEPWNLAPACRACNAEKFDMLPGDFLDRLMSREDFPPTSAFVLLEAERRYRDGLEPLLSIVPYEEIVYMESHGALKVA